MIRDATENDLVAISYIYNYAVNNTAATFDIECRPPEYFMKFFTDIEFYHYLCICERDGEVVGFAGLYPFSRRKAYSCMSEILCYVHPDYHNQGVGKSLISYLDKFIFDSDLHTVLALFNKSNNPIRRILTSAGFQHKGELEEVAIKFDKYHSLDIYQKIYLRR